MKNIKKVFAIILAVGSMATLAGCSSTTYSSVSTAANWNVATSTTVEMNFAEYWRTHKEVVDYSVTFEEGGNSSYKVEYFTADPETTYKTAFYMDANEYDWSSESLPEGIKITSDTAIKDAVYVYETTLVLKGRYILASTKEAVEFSDSVITTCKYRLAGEDLKPVYSKQEVKSTAPNTLTAISKDSMCAKTNAVYETFYNRDCNTAIVKTTNNEDNTTTQKSIALEGLVFDNSQLPAALRSFSLTGTKMFTVCAPQNGSAQQCTVSCAAPAELSNESQLQIITALKNVNDGNGNKVNDYIIFDGDDGDAETKDKQIRYTAISLGITADMKGATPVYSYATVENSDVNTTRSMLLKVINPLSFGLGSLTYTVKNISIVNA